MTALALDGPSYSVERLSKTISWNDTDSDCTIVLTRPPLEPLLWQEYLQGAFRSYQKHRVENALDLEAIADGSDTALFYSALDRGGRVVGGLRAKGPYHTADESHAIAEWAGQPGQDAVRTMITNRLPFGVVEMKSAWVGDDFEHGRTLTRTFARTAFPTMALLGAQFILATAGSHVLNRWRSSGGVVADKIPPTPYPNEHYRTRIMWWDRRTFANHADPKQLAKTISEMATLAKLSDEFAELGMVYGRGM